AGAPEQPGSDAAFVLCFVAADVVAQVEQRFRRLDPRSGRDVVVALGRGWKGVGVDRGVVLRPLVVAQVGLSSPNFTSRGRSTPEDGAAQSRSWCRRRGRA